MSRESHLTSIHHSLGREITRVSKDAPGYYRDFSPTSWVVLTGEPVPSLNMSLISSGPDELDAAHKIDGLYRQRKIAGVLFLTDTVKATIKPELLSWGWQSLGQDPHMTWKPQRISDRTIQLDISTVSDEESLRAATKIQAESFDYPLAELNRTMGEATLQDPNVKIFLGRIDGIPVTTVTTIKDQAGVVGVWSMATEAKFRRKGYGERILANAMKLHDKDGAHLLHLLATTAGFNLYTRLGFTNASRLEVLSIDNTNRVLF